ncbi:MAG: DNA polymerase III subunit gamma/tau [Comamonadaceae bacterium]|nr:MAG: DNA polymerase III subunit gamma/tau [Comamonadaceae bacterium]
MSYLVLARKYRPKTFSEMVGQEHVVQALTNALTTQRLHHAYLFTGTRGVGKTTVSRILAKSLNCQGPDGTGGITATPCGVCRACVDIDAGRFVDYTELDAASNRGVDEVQSLLEQAVYKPVQGRFKVFMIDEVHMLTNTAFNAMLKTLEEPPEYLKFVLATTDPQKVPVTVLSRCLQFNLRPMAPETVLDHLAEVLAAEEVPAETQALRLIARAARGSMRDALSLTDQAIAFGNGGLLEAGVRQMLGSVDRGHVFRLIEALAAGDGLSVVETAEGLRRDGQSAASTLEEMTAVLQAMAVYQSVPARAQVAEGSSDPDAAETARLARSMPPDETQLLYSICLHGRGELGLAPDEYAGLTMVLLRLLAFKPPGTMDGRAGGMSRARPAAVDAADPVSSPLVALAEPAATMPTTPDARADADATASMPAEAPTKGSTDAEASPEPVPPASPPAVSVAEPASAAADAAAASGVAAAAAAAAAPAAFVATSSGSASVPSLPRASPADSTGSADAADAADAAGAAATPRRPALVAMPLRVQPPPSAREAPRPRTDAAPVQPIVPSEEGDFWHEVVGQLVASEAIAALARELALQSQLVARDVDQWLLRVERESLNSSGSRDRLQTALAGLGHGVRLVVEVGVVVDSPARRHAQAAALRQQQAEEAIRNDPLVQAMVRDYDAKIVPGSLRPD